MNDPSYNQYLYQLASEQQRWCQSQYSMLYNNSLSGLCGALNTGPYTGWYDKDNERYKKGQPTSITRKYDWKEILKLNPRILN